MDPLRAAILTISTTASVDPTTDTTGPALRDALERQENAGWRVDSVRIVADDLDAIRDAVTTATDNDAPPNLLLLTGGTGFATSDVTPEAVKVLLHKEAPLLVYGMIESSIKKTPFAMMSRPVAGTRNKTLIITLPGSPKGALENLDAVVRVLPHACLQAAGANTRKMHAGGVKKLEAEAGLAPAPPSPHARGCGLGHAHAHHGHGGLVRYTADDDSRPRSNDPNRGPGHRHRESPYPMVPVDEALALVNKHLAALEVVEADVESHLVGAVLAEDVIAGENVPAFRASIVDGYAIAAPADGRVKGTYRVVDVSHASASPAAAKRLGRGESEVARVTTGAPVPDGATCVVMVEDTILRSATDNGREEELIEILAERVSEGDNIREVGSDIRKGSVILTKGERISGTGGDIGLLASVGASTVKVTRRPVVAFFSTGNEIVDKKGPGGLAVGQVRDANRPALLSVLGEWGYTSLDLGIAPDDPAGLEEKLRTGLHRADVVVTTGGVSMGELDLLKPTIERTLGGTIHFGRVAMKPGKPTTFATVPCKDNDGVPVEKPIFALPGNPASAVVTFHLFVLPALRRLSGLGGPAARSGLPKASVLLTESVPMGPRPEYHRAVVFTGSDGSLRARSTGGQRSSRVASFRSANALLCVPAGDGMLCEGQRVDALMMGPLAYGGAR